jgi:hypothetical protein
MNLKNTYLPLIEKIKETPLENYVDHWGKIYQKMGKLIKILEDYIKELSKKGS